MMIGGGTGPIGMSGYYISLWMSEQMPGPLRCRDNNAKSEDTKEQEIRILEKQVNIIKARVERNHQNTCPKRQSKMTLGYDNILKYEKG